jgi:hypothetical protein
MPTTDDLGRIASMEWEFFLNPFGIQEVQIKNLMMYREYLEFSAHVEQN